MLIGGIKLSTAMNYILDGVLRWFFGVYEKGFYIYSLTFFMKIFERGR